MRIVTPSAALIASLLDIRSPSSMIHGRGRPCHLLTNTRQLFAYEHVDDAASTENGLHHYTSGTVVSHFADPRRSFAKRMRLERRQCRVSIFRWHDTDDLPFVRKIQRIKAQNLAEAFDLTADRRAVFINLDTHLRSFGNFVQDSGKSSTRRIPQKASTRNC